MKVRTRLWIVLVFLGLAALAAETLRIRAPSSIALEFRERPPKDFTVAVSVASSAANGERNRLLTRGDTGRERELEFYLPRSEWEDMRFEFHGARERVVLRAIMFRKAFREVEILGGEMASAMHPLAGIREIRDTEDGVLIDFEGPEFTTGFVPKGMERFSMIGRKFLYPIIAAAALFLFLALGPSYERWWRYRELVANLARVNLLLKYRGSVLGLLWSLLNPLLMIAIYSVAFKYIMRIQLENYTFFLLVGLLPWSFFASSVVASTGCVIGSAGLLKKVYFPREVFPLSSVAFFFVQFLLSLLAFIPFVILWKGQFQAVNLLYVPLMLLLLLFSVGLSLALSALTVLYRDLQHFTEVGMTALFWLSPVIYNMELIPGRFRPWFQLNPMVLFMASFHDVLYWDQWPDPRVILPLTVWTLGAVALGAFLFRRIDARFAEET
jgi:ABC-type polysaccharide/polyol phosphate export permease